MLGWGRLPAGQRGLPWGEPCRRRALGATTEALCWGHLPAGQRGLPRGEPCRRRALGVTKEALGLRRLQEAAMAVALAAGRP